MQSGITALKQLILSFLINCEMHRLANAFLCASFRQDTSLVAPTSVFMIRGITEWEWRREATSLCRWIEYNQDTHRHLVPHLTRRSQFKCRNSPELQPLKRKIILRLYVHQLSTHRSRYFTAQALQHSALLKLPLLFIWITVSGWHRNWQNYARLSWQSYRFLCSIH